MEEFSVQDPLGRTITAPVVFYRDQAIIEMARASGIELIDASEQDIMRCSTFGTGQLLAEAFQSDSKSIIISMGGSATNDGGMHMMRALGVDFRDSAGRSIERFQDACQISSINVDKITYNVDNKSVIGATDVVNPLLGREGATMIFGPQKGGDKITLHVLEEAMRCYADQVNKCMGTDFTRSPGAGAAGGLGFAVKSFFNAELRPGFELMAEIVDLESQIAWSDIVITGEGKLDRQTGYGKAPARLRQMARKHGKKVWVIAGRTEDGAGDEFDGVISLSDLASGQKEAMREPEKWLERAVRIALEQITSEG